MYDQAQKEKFVTTMVNSIEYLNKELTIRHVLEFLRANPNFSPRETVRELSGGSFVCFIEMTGFVQIERSHVEMYIGVPAGYPRNPPFFLLALDRNNFEVFDEQKLLQHNLIALEKNAKKEDFIRLRFPVIEKEWNPQLLTINSAFLNLMQIINRPPLIRLKFQPEFAQSQFRPLINQNAPNKIKRLNSNEVTQIVAKTYSDIAEVLTGRQSLEQSSQFLDYNQSRQLFLKQHLSALKVKLVGTRKAIDNQCQIIRRDLKEVEDKGECDRLLVCSQNEKDKLDALSEQQALKEAEVKLRAKMQKQSNKFSDYKKIMKVLYQKMFENQTKLLKLIK